ncbi:MAG TPA: zinc-binding dehydrogenase, partial [Holophaga sp.]|nr:zinc-binding dehydrogenase [Holophaga sp.]
FTHIARREDLDAISRELFDVVLSGKVEIAVDRSYPLAEAAQAHRDLEARLTHGACILVP